MIDVTIRAANTDDISFLMNSWLKSYRYGSWFTKRIRDSVYFKYHHQIVTGILSRGSCNVIVAVDPTDTYFILGYLVSEKFEDKNIIHYAYVKDTFRGKGVGRKLIEASGLDLNKCCFSHWTKPVDEIIKKYAGMTYIPYLV